MGGTQQREALSVQPPWLPLCDHDPEEDPAGLREDPGLRAPGIFTEKPSPRKPLPDPVPGLLPPVTLGSLCQIWRLQAGHQPGPSPKSRIRAGAQSGPTPETRHGQHTGTRSPGGHSTALGAASPGRNRGRKTLLEASCSPGCSPRSSLPRLVDETRTDARWSLNPTLFCPPLNAVT